MDVKPHPVGSRRPDRNPPQLWKLGAAVLILAVLFVPNGPWTHWRIYRSARTLVDNDAFSSEQVAAAKYLAAHYSLRSRQALAFALVANGYYDVRVIAARVIGDHAASGDYALLVGDYALLAFAAMHDVSADVRAAAAEALGRSGDRQFVPYLSFVALRDAYDEVRMAALVALGHLGDTGSAATILHAAATLDLSPEVLSATDEALAELGGPVEASVRQMLTEPLEPVVDSKPPPDLFTPDRWNVSVSGIPSDPSVNVSQEAVSSAFDREHRVRNTRAHSHFDLDPHRAIDTADVRDAEVHLAIALVRRWKDRAAVPQLLALAPRVPEAVTALAEIAGPDVVDSLVTLLGSQDAKLAKAAVAALTALGEAAVGPTLRALSGPASIQIRATRILADHHDEEQVISTLLALLDSSDNEVRHAAVTALSGTRSERVVAPLVKRLRDYDEDVQIDAIYALSHFQSAAPALASRITDGQEKERVRISAIWTLRDLNVPLSEPTLIETLKVENSAVRAAAASALGSFDSAESGSALAGATRDRSREVRFAAAYALERRRDPRAIPTLIERMGSWEMGPVIAEQLKSAFDAWQPTTDLERVRYYVATRDQKQLLDMWPTTRRVLLADVRAEDYDVIMNALYAFIGLGREEILSDLVRSLDESGTKTTAEAYVNCGNRKLYEAGRRWAHRHGYMIQVGPGAAPVGWGRM